MLQTSTSETYGSVPHFWTEGFFIARKSSSRKCANNSWFGWFWKVVGNQTSAVRTAIDALNHFSTPPIPIPQEKWRTPLSSHS